MAITGKKFVEQRFLLHHRPSRGDSGGNFAVVAESLLLLSLMLLILFIIDVVGGDALSSSIMSRTPKPFPRVVFNNRPDGKPITNIDEFTPDSVLLEGYDPMPPIKMQMAL
uniref:Thymidylate synthase n=1 Tax=Globodera rostochiensis TaxID=31243 RepID=A0A914HDF0_GLORO